jgi:hypothetical protein
MLIGASDRDNLWQWTGKVLTDQLDRMKAAGGNYVRNTMSDRDEGDTYAAKLLPNGKYDLSQWNEEYWDKSGFFSMKPKKERSLHKLRYGTGLTSPGFRKFWPTSAQSGKQYQLGTRNHY